MYTYYIYIYIIIIYFCLLIFMQGLEEFNFSDRYILSNHSDFCHCTPKKISYIIPSKGLNDQVIVSMYVGVLVVVTLSCLHLPNKRRLATQESGECLCWCILLRILPVCQLVGMVGLTTNWVGRSVAAAFTAAELEGELLSPPARRTLLLAIA